MLSTSRAATRAGIRAVGSARISGHRYRVGPPSDLTTNINRPSPSRFFRTYLTVWRDEADERTKQRQASLYTNTKYLVSPPPRTYSSIPTNRRFASTTATVPPTTDKSLLDESTVKATTSGGGSQNKDPPPPPPPSNNPKEQKECDDNDELPHSMREKIRARYDAKREEIRCRAEDYRDSARTHYAEFKEHPRQTAREGAVSIGGMIQQYGPVFVGTYATVYLSTLGLLFAGVESGALDPVVLFQWLGQSNESASTVQLVVDFMENHSFTRPYAHLIEKNPSVANLAVAWIAVKFTEPIRLAVSFAVTPRVARYLGYSKKDTTTDEEKVQEDKSEPDNSEQTKKP